MRQVHSFIIGAHTKHRLQNQFAIINSQLQLTTVRPKPIAFEASSTFLESHFHLCSFKIRFHIYSKLQVGEVIMSQLSISRKISTTFLRKPPRPGKQSVFPRIPTRGLSQLAPRHQEPASRLRVPALIASNQ